MATPRKKGPKFPCSATVSDPTPMRAHLGDTACKIPASVERDGLHYCGVHDPARRRARPAARSAEAGSPSDAERIAALEAERRALRAALAPFAKYRLPWAMEEHALKRTTIYTVDRMEQGVSRAYRLRLGDFLAAREAYDWEPEKRGGGNG